MKQFTISIAAEGDVGIINLSPELGKRVRDLEGHGLLHVFAQGSTVAVTTLEFEPGLVGHDLREVLQRIAPDDARYAHEATWNDDNGHSHVRAALIGPQIMVPFANGKLLTGEYQQVVLINLDTRPRKRTVIVSVLT